MKNTQVVLDLIDKGVPPLLALEQEGFGEVSETTMELLQKRANAARSLMLQKLYEAANDKRSTPANRAKALEMWSKLSKESDISKQNVTIIINGEREKV